MSADNYVAVLRKATDGGYDYYVIDGNESMNSEDCQYVGHVVAVISDDRLKALGAAHDYADKLPVLEYGVTEGNYPAIGDFCGRCYVCIEDRKIVADDVPRCDFCKEPIHSSDWTVSTYRGRFHRGCEKSG